MISPSQAAASQCHYDDLLTEAARTHLITAATHHPASATPRTAARLGAGLRRVVASLAALVAIG